MGYFRNSDTGETNFYHARRRNFGYSLSHRGKIPFFQSSFFLQERIPAN
ncbi:hypothetical protein LEP1GSC125_1397 [Leptospira mayottensis 200901122]|uniref:Uncharacterized protein n=1 Tax=Leptospira mayottensis 200901122 TaxID=1193010 RepID=A0AA87MQF2_9LEPT|nr:hypothetical protein LEP1GSC125_1397 [Leptospira mayottensis 200901122]